MNLERGANPVAALTSGMFGRSAATVATRWRLGLDSCIRISRARNPGYCLLGTFGPDGTMTSATQALTDKDIDVLVDYLAGLGGP